MDDVDPFDELFGGVESSGNDQLYAHLKEDTEDPSAATASRIPESGEQVQVKSNINEPRKEDVISPDVKLDSSSHASESKMLIADHSTGSDESSKTIVNDKSLVDVERGKVDSAIPGILSSFSGLSTASAKSSSADEIDWGENDGMIINPTSGKQVFCKGVPSSHKDTWDFSLRDNSNPDNKTKTFWIEGNFYKKFHGECLHEMVHVNCNCEEKKRFSVCRQCHIVFCSTKCFKQVIREITGVKGGKNAENPEASADEYVNDESKERVPRNGTGSSVESRGSKSSANHAASLSSTGRGDKSSVLNEEGNSEKKVTAFRKKGYREEGKSAWKDNKSNKMYNDGAHSRHDTFQRGSKGNKFQHGQSGSNKRATPSNSNPRWHDTPPSNLWPSQISNKNSLMSGPTTSTAGLLPTPSTPPVVYPSPGMSSLNSPADIQQYSNNLHPQSYNSSNINHQPLQPALHFSGVNNRNNPGKQGLLGHAPFHQRQMDSSNNSNAEIFDKSSQSKNDTLGKVMRNSKPNGTIQEETTTGGYSTGLNPERTRTPRANFNPGVDQNSNSKRNSQRNNRTEGNGGTPSMNYTTHQDHNTKESSSLQDTNAPATMKAFTRRRPQGNYPDRSPTFPSNSAQDMSQEYSRGEANENFVLASSKSFGQTGQRNDSDARDGFRRNQRSGSSRPLNSFNEPRKHNEMADWQPSPKKERDYDSDHSGFGKAFHQHQKSGNRIGDNNSYRQNFTTASVCSDSSSSYKTCKTSLSSNTQQRSLTSSVTWANQMLEKVNPISMELDIPFGIPMQAKCIAGTNFDDLAVMIPQSEAMQPVITTLLRNCKKTKQDVFEFGDFCIVNHACNGEEWFRAIITKVVQKIGVYLLDLGVSLLVEGKSIYKLPTELLNYAPLAIRMKCTNIKFDANNQEFCDYFSSLIADKTVKVKVTHKVGWDSYMYAGSLEVFYVGKWFDVGVLLQKFQVAESVSEENIDVDGLSKVEAGEPIPQISLQCSTDKTVEVRVIYAVSVNEFFVSTMQSQKRKVKIEQQLTSKAIQDCKSVEELRDLSVSNPLFAFRHECSGKYVRAKILEVLFPSGKPAVTVQLVDIGEILTVPITDLKILPPDFLDLGCVVKCSLPVKPSPKPRSRTAKAIPYNDLTKFLIDLYERPVGLVVFSVENSDTFIVELFLNDARTGCAQSFVRNSWAVLSHDVDLNCLKNRN